MDNTTENLIAKILDITGYERAKQEFIDEFISNIQLEALVNITSAHPDQKDEWMKALNQMESADDLKQFIENNIPSEEYAKEIEEVSDKNIQSYLRSIEGSLTENQKYNIAKLNI